MDIHRHRHHAEGKKKLLPLRIEKGIGILAIIYNQNVTKTANPSTPATEPSKCEPAFPTPLAFVFPPEVVVVALVFPAASVVVVSLLHKLPVPSAEPLFFVAVAFPLGAEVISAELTLVLLATTEVVVAAAVVYVNSELESVTISMARKCVLAAAPVMVL